MIYIGIGSNLGNRIKNIIKAKYLLNLNGIKITKSSSYYETLSWPDPSNPKFINVIVQSNTKISPEKFLIIFKSIEKKLGRKKSAKNWRLTCQQRPITLSGIPCPRTAKNPLRLQARLICSAIMVSALGFSNCWLRSINGMSDITASFTRLIY